MQKLETFDEMKNQEKFLNGKIEKLESDFKMIVGKNMELTRNLEVVWVVVRKDFNNEFNIHMHLFLTQISLVLGSDDAKK